MREWTGAIVERRLAIDLHRHPQEFQKIVAEKQVVENPRPRTADVFGGPLTTQIGADGSPGDTTITVDSTSRFSSSDAIGIMLQRGDLFRTTVSSITDATTLVIASALPKAVQTGDAVINYTATVAADLG